MNEQFQIYQYTNNNREEILSNYSKEFNYQINTCNTKNELKCQLNLVEHYSEQKFPDNYLSEINESNLNKLINEFIDIFSKDKYDIGRITIEYCEINLTNNIPIHRRPYRCSQKDQDTIDSQIQKLSEKGLIRKSISSYAFPITLADKKDEGKRTRLTMDYRPINEITMPDNFPFPLFADIIDKLRDCEFFTSLDITSGFWHIPMASKDIHKTAFVTMHEHFEWLVMPFGYRNSPQIFQRILQTVLKKHNLFSFARNYLDDILIFSKTFSEHLNHIRLVLNAIKNENIKLKLSKCQFARKSVNYLGHTIIKNHFTPINDNLIAIKNFPKPENIKMLERFLGKLGYYYRFIPNAHKLLAPLYRLKKKNVNWDWDTKCDNAFHLAITFLTSRPVLCIYDPNRECILYTDASKIGLGAVLKQKQDDNFLHPIGYFSKKLLDYQKNYDITELECLAIVQSIEFWHHYLYGKKFIIYCDHNPLRWIKTTKKPNSRLFNWSLKLSQYNFDIKYIPGKNNQESDCLSRCPVIESFDDKEHIKIVNLLEKQELIDYQTKYRDNIGKEYEIENDLFVKVKNNFHKIFVPNELEYKLLDKFHKEFGHIGAKKMLALIASSFHVKKLSCKISDYLSKCKICQTNKINRKLKLGELSLLGPAKEPYDIISIDTIGGFSGYNSAKQYVHLAIDNFTRYIWTLASKTQSAKDFINLIKNVCQTQKPKLVLADRYTGIKSTEFSNYLSKNEIKIMYTTVNCPQSNGMCERANQTIVTRLRCKLNDFNQNVCWPKLLEKVTEEYNKTPHSVTKFSPSYLLIGVKPFEPLINGPELTLDSARKQAFDNSMRNHEINKSYYDKKHISTEFKVGDLVYVENKNEINRRKLEPLMSGPFKVVGKLSKISYLVECDKKGKQNDVYHISKLRLCNP